MTQRQKPGDPAALKTDSGIDIASTGMIFEGIVSVRAVLESREAGISDRKIRTILYAQEKKEENGKEWAWLSHRAEEQGFELKAVPRSEIDRIAVGTTHGGILAVCSDRMIPDCSELVPAQNGFYVLLEGIEDPYNFGYAIRSIYASGADALILSPRNWMSCAGIVCRASAGASERIPLFTYSDDAILQQFRQKGIRVVCADQKNAVSAVTADLSGGILLVIGGERRGISSSLRKQADLTVSLNYGRPFPEALSAASAASILAFEILRQRNHPR